MLKILAQLVTLEVLDTAKRSVKISLSRSTSLLAAIVSLLSTSPAYVVRFVWSHLIVHNRVIFRFCTSLFSRLGKFRIVNKEMPAQEQKT